MAKQKQPNTADRIAAPAQDYSATTTDVIQACFGGKLVEGYADGLKLIQSWDEKDIFVWVGTYKHQGSAYPKIGFAQPFFKTEEKYTFNPKTLKLSLQEFKPS